MFSVAKICQIKDMSKYLHPRWLIKNYQALKVHEITQKHISDLKQNEDKRRKKTEDTNENAIHFQEDAFSC